MLFLEVIPAVHSLALPLIAVTYVGVAVGEFPRLRMNRATIALVGAVALIILGIMPLDAALQALDADTLLLLLAMMIVNAHLAMAGFFDWTANVIVTRARSPRVLLACVVASGLLAALFLNDTIVLMFTPLVVHVALTLERNPIPYLMGLATGANIGSTATITGNPQNMLIGLSSHIPFLGFLAALAPVAIIGLVLDWAIIVWVYHSEFLSERFEIPSVPPVKIDAGLLGKTLLLTAAMFAALILGAPIPLAAMAAAAGLLVTRRIDPERIFSQIDWALLVFFGSLFVVTGALVYSGWSDSMFAVAEPIAAAGVAPLAVVTAVLSNLVSNVPAVLLFRPLVPRLAEPTRVWLVLAMASTLAGNLTLLGSVANLIVAESARAKGVKLSFVEYLKVGVPITLLTIAVGVLWLIFLPI